MALANLTPNPLTEPEHIRRLWPSDVETYRAHLLRLEPEARYSRFGTVMSDAIVADHANLCAAPDTLVYGCFIDGEIRGAAELHILFPEPGEARRQGEAAFSIERPWRHSGHGSALVERLLLAARNRGLRSLTISCLPQNVAMQKLAKKFGATLTSEIEEVTGRIRVDLPTPQSMLTEAFENTLDFASAVLDLQKRFLHLPAGPRGFGFRA